MVSRISVTLYNACIKLVQQMTVRVQKHDGDLRARHLATKINTRRC